MKLLFLAIAFICMTTVPDRFIEAVVVRNNTMLCFKLKTLNFEGKVVIERVDLFEYFLKKYNLSEKSYDSLMIQELQDGALELEDSVDLRKCKFHIVKEIECVKNNALKGKEEFLKIYFNDYDFKSDSIVKENYIIPNIEEVEQEHLAVIYQLFQWKIAVIRECESGYWFILKDFYLYGE
jgi:hypothetical protein